MHREYHRFCTKLLNRTAGCGNQLSAGNILIVQHYVEQGTVDLQSAFYSAGVVDEAQFPEPVHEKTDSRTSSSNHFGQCLLTDFGNYRFRNALLAEMREQ